MAQRSKSAEWRSRPTTSPANGKKALSGVWAKLIILAALLCLWGVIALVRLPSETPYRPGGVSTDVNGPRTRGGTVANLPRLETKLLTIPNEQYPPQAANLFAVPPPPPPPPVVAVQPAAPPAPPPPDPFQEAAKDLHFIGFLKTDVAAAAIVTQGTDLYIAAAGETVAARFRVLSVQEDTVTLASIEGDRQIQLTLPALAGPGAAPIRTVPGLQDRMNAFRSRGLGANVQQ